MSQQLKTLLTKYLSCFEVVGDRIVCRFNGHEIKCDEHAYNQLNNYIKGKKFQNVLKEKEADAAIEKYAPFIIPSIVEKQMFFCALTGKYIKKDMQYLKMHLKGKKFNRAKELFQEDKLELFCEPGMEPKKEEEDDEEEEEVVTMEQDDSTQQQEEQDEEDEELQSQEDQMRVDKKGKSISTTMNITENSAPKLQNVEGGQIQTNGNQEITLDDEVLMNGVHGEDIQQRKTKKNPMKQKAKRRRV
eukprot:TRINITY_DN9066_c0_g3_i1.p2 TRINITY_DN9066_c0_g3~~TRINITY_DN9066_c0_g3_i1.p2  ORF type:complete len:256 (-),score=51.33 TRINITY_DN9066_c0_g3_i1:193-927(-)